MFIDNSKARFDDRGGKRNKQANVANSLEFILLDSLPFMLALAALLAFICEKW